MEEEDAGYTPCATCEGECLEDELDSAGNCPPCSNWLAGREP